MSQADKLKRTENFLLDSEKNLICKLKTFYKEQIKIFPDDEFKDLFKKGLKDLENQEERINKMIALQDAPEYFEDLLKSCSEIFNTISTSASIELPMLDTSIFITKQDVQEYENLSGKERDDFVHIWHIKQLLEIA